MSKSNDPKLDSWLGLATDNLYDILKSSCRLCMTPLPQSGRINMVSVERKGVRLLEIANQLTALNIADQTEAGVPMELCLSCAGKLVNFHEFREACHKNEREFDTIYTAIQLKTKFNQSQGLQDDEDMQVIYVCRCCKEQFENNAEYLEHKKIHNTVTSTPSKESTREDNQMVFNLANLSAIPTNNNTAEIKLEDGTFPCRHCSDVFNSALSRDQHENSHKDGAKKTVPPLILKKTAGKRKLRKLRVLKAKDCYTENLNVDSDDQTAAAAVKKEFKCDKCLMLFPNFKSKWWHDIKHHKILPLTGEDKRKRRGPQVCRHCGLTFDQYIQKYRHEKRCKAGSTSQPAEADVAPSSNAELPNDVKPEEDLEEYKAKCSKCSEEFSSRRAKTMHEKHVHNLDIRECRICHKIFSSYPGRYIHEKRCGLKRSLVEA